MKKKTHVTIYDLAAELKVSPSTISRALSGHNSISKEKVKEIIQLAKKRNYIPNDIASNLRKAKSNNIGVITTWINRTFHSEIISGVEEEVSNKGMNVIILQSHDRYKDEVENAKALLNSRVSGLIVSLAMETKNYDHFEPFFRNQIPVVFADRAPGPEIKCHQVLIDNELTAYVATKHLIDQGCRRIAHLSGQKHRENYKERIQGYNKALRESGLRLDKKYIYELATKSAEEGVMATRELMSLPEPPDAIFCTNDSMAIAIIQFCKSVGIKIPEQLCIMGFNNDPTCKIIEPNLTSTVNPGFEIGKESGKLLLDLLHFNWKPKEYRTITLDTQLIARESTARLNFVKKGKPALLETFQ
ncbi:MAG: LacI family DNA-binding transcriptional regulator [Saprospiraceae bacterium]